MWVATFTFTSATALNAGASVRDGWCVSQHMKCKLHRAGDPQSKVCFKDSSCVNTPAQDSDSSAASTAQMVGDSAAITAHTLNVSSALARSNSARTPRSAPTRRRPLHRDTTITDNSQTCAAFGWEPLNESSRTPRRLFLGALIASEPPIVLQALSAEIAHVVSFVSFVEPAQTQTGTPRVLQYGSATHHGRGPQFQWLAKLFAKQGVAINVSSPPLSQRRSLDVEWEWRRSIVDAWITHGMRSHDVGIISDTDEVFTHDALYALRDCDVPQFRLDTATRDGCTSPKILGSTLTMEGYFDCVWGRRRWYHPDAMLGACIEGIPGNPVTEKAINKRAARQKEIGGRITQRNDRTMRAGLWAAGDFRCRAGGVQMSSKVASGFHFHNFGSERWLRHKYQTYGHPITDADSRPLQLLHRDLNLSLHCKMGISHPDRSNSHYTYDYGFSALKIAAQPLPRLLHNAMRCSQMATGSSSPFSICNATYIQTYFSNAKFGR